MTNLNPNSIIPLYYQLKEILIEEISDGKWKEGEQIPGEIAISEQYEVSRSTVRQAIDTLVKLGLLNRIQGKGTFVSKHKVEGNFIKFNLPNDTIKKHKLIQIQSMLPSESIRKALKISEHEKVIELIRLRYLDGEPIVLKKWYIPQSFCPELTNYGAYEDLYKWFEKERGLELYRASTFIEPVLLDEFEEKLFGVDLELPALLLTRISCLKSDNTPVIYVKNLIRGDRCRLFFNAEELTANQIDI